MDTDVLVVGGGPAGLAAAVASAAAGAHTLVVDPAPAEPWPNTYGMWVDDAVDLEVPLRRRYADPVVVVPGRSVRGLRRSYGLVDNVALRDRLEAHLPDRTVHAGRVERLAHDSAGSTAHLADGSRVTARLVVVAAGAGGGGRLLEGDARTASEPPPAWQTAYGLRTRLDPPLLAPGEMTLMDWRPPAGAAADLDGVPTFLYALDLGDGRALVEETVLAARPAVRIDRLVERLHMRLDAAGHRPCGDAEAERVAIPMGGPLPRRAQRAVAFGAAAGLVHPATGYSLGTSLRRAGALGAAIADAKARGATPEQTAAHAWSAVWTDDLVRQRDLHRYGLECLLRLPPRHVGSFFDSFFDLPRERWAAYLGTAGSARQLAGIMLAVFRRLPRDVQRTLLGGALRPERRWLLGGLSDG